MPWHDLRIWLSGFFAAAAIATFAMATMIRLRARASARKMNVSSVPRKPAAKTGTAG
jgi:hypothetical protein